MRITNTGLLYDDPSQSTPGYVLISPVRGNKAFLLDPDGEVAHEWQTAGGMTHWSYVMPNGHLIANERCDDPRGVMLTVSGIISDYAPDNRLAWRHIDPYQHHDARRLEDGAIYSAFCDLNDAEKSAIQGGVPGSEADGGPFGEVIRQVNEAGETVWEWSFHNLDMEGNKGCIFEVNPDGDVVREFVSPHFVNNKDFGWINWLFRTRWYGPDSPEVQSLGL